MSRRMSLLVAAIVLLVNTVQWVVAEFVTAAAWTDPPYSYAANYIPLVNASPGTAGLFERGGVYSWLLWGLVTGLLVVQTSRRAAVQRAAV